MTKAVTETTRERLEREQRRRANEALVGELMAIARRVASYPRKDRRSHGDQRGLPRSDG
jgi:hypothetical protein